ncbi:NUDIX hydrolase [Kiloniella sp.]|uniref:NUDIX hydrolase n=1 Tax=Kiloniella sp. TaxID=1938587 RepID=UPI003B02CD54
MTDFSTPKDPDTIRIAAAVISNDQGKVLLVRKRGTSFFMQAGGKIEQGEDPLIALGRELQEELSFKIVEEDCHYLGRFSAKAANEDNAMVEAEIYHIESNLKVTAQAEIEQLIWIDPRNMGSLKVAPLTEKLLKEDFAS